MDENASHPGTAMRSRVPDHEHFAFPVLFILDGPAARFLPVKARRTGYFQARHPRNLNDGIRRRAIALEPDDATGGGKRLIGGADHTLVPVPLYSRKVLGNGWPRHTTAIEQSPRRERNMQRLAHMFGEITAERLQIRAIGMNREQALQLCLRCQVRLHCPSLPLSLPTKCRLRDL